MDHQKVKTVGTSNRRQWWMLFSIAVLTFSTGCTSIVSPINAIPAARVPPELLAIPTANDRNIEIPRLRQKEPEAYILDVDDVLGIYVETLFSDDPTRPVRPIVTIQEASADLAPAIGEPYPIREDGTVSIPTLGRVAVRGLTLEQAEELVKRKFVEQGQLKKGVTIIVSLLKKRDVRVFVIRQDNATGFGNQGALLSRQAINQRSDFSSRGFVLHLPAYRNDVLNALTETGGMPGVNAKPFVKVLRGGGADFKKRERQLKRFFQRYGTSNTSGLIPELPEDESVVKIPLRLKPGKFPTIDEEDIILNDGDVVLVESRESEVYYTGGLLRPGEFLLPRDKDLDVLSAVALAGVSVGSTSNTGGFASGLTGASGSLPPTQLIVLRQLPGNKQIPIEVDLTEAINDPKERILVKAGDTLILRHKPKEEAINFALGTFFTFGIRELFR